MQDPNNIQITMSNTTLPASLPANINERMISLEIQKIFEENQIDDLKRFMSHRKTLNCANNFLIYLFHFIQSAGILTTTIAAGYNEPFLVWVGVGLNLLASLIHIYEKTNETISKKLLKDIIAIKNRTYTDESIIIDDIDKKSIPEIGHDKHINGQQPNEFSGTTNNMPNMPNMSNMPNMPNISRNNMYGLNQMMNMNNNELNNNFAVPQSSLNSLTEIYGKQNGFSNNNSTNNQNEISNLNP
jgi:hypothetical protein